MSKVINTKIKDVLHPIVHHNQTIKDYLNQNATLDTVNDAIQIKINSDGVQMTRNSNFILLSFSILQTGESVMSAKGNRTIAIVNGFESYKTIKEAFGGSLMK